MSVYTLRYDSPIGPKARDIEKTAQKLVALLQLKVPPEVQLSRARASLLRVTFVLDFGVPQISIEVDGIQIQAQLAESEKEVAVASRPVIGSSRRRPASPSALQDSISDDSSHDDEHVPTVDELAQSFLRAEPAADIRELENELGNQSAYMQDSVALSDAGSDEGTAGMGAPLALPTYLRNILNTALDRLTITVNDVDIEVEDQISDAGIGNSRSNSSSPTTLHFHIDRITVDSLGSPDLPPGSQPSGSSTTSPPPCGQRRLHMQHVCARLVSDVENFVTLSRVSRPESPVVARPDIIEDQIHEVESSQSAASIQSVRSIPTPQLEHSDQINRLIGSDQINRLESSVQSAQFERSEQLPHSPQLTSSAQLPAVEQSVQDLAISLRADENPLTSSNHMSLSTSTPAPYTQKDLAIEQARDLPEPYPSVVSMHTADDDRFADANSDDGMAASFQGEGLVQSRQAASDQALDTSGILYDDEGNLDYAINNDMLTSHIEHRADVELSQKESDAFNPLTPDRQQYERVSLSASEASISTLPTVSALGRSFKAPVDAQSPNESLILDRSSVDIASFPQVSDIERTSSANDEKSSASIPSLTEDLAKSLSSSQDDSESMYMSAISAAHSTSIDVGGLPGGWESSSNSSKAASEQSGSVPEDMVSGSILEPLPEVEEGVATPRPGSPQSAPSSSKAPRMGFSNSPAGFTHKQAKLFLSIDEITVWFPLSIDEQQDARYSSTESTETSRFDFSQPNLGDDSIFAEMPGSFSNYANSSSHRRNKSTDEAAKKPAIPRTTRPSRNSAQPGKTASPCIKIGVSSIASHIDLSTGRILFGMLSHVLAALASPANSTDTNSKMQDHPVELSSVIELSVKHVGIAWLENIVAEEQVEKQMMEKQLKLNPVDAILRARISEIQATSQSGPRSSRTKLQVGEFVFACLDQDIIAFQKPRQRPRRSTSNVTEQLGNDVEIDLEQTGDKRITIVTRPVKIMLDVQKLDEALGCFGGFSGMLELSSSISSASTVQSPVISQTPPKPRGVHFGDGVPAPMKVPVEVSASPKIQIQTGEVIFTLKGRTCAVQVQTTSVRAALRANNVRLKISEIKISGPYVDAVQSGTPLVVEIRGTTVNFLFAPEESDLARLISLITPSKDPYENNDDILIDTLLRQRRKGSVLRVEISELGIRVSDLEQMKTFEALGAELARLSKVTKYLPDDDRPGLLSLTSVKRLDARIAINEQLGDVSIVLEDAAVAHVGVPALLATEIGKAVVTRDDEVLVHEVIQLRPQDQLPAIMLRLVGDEMEPMVKAKLFNVCVEYRVSTVMAALGLSETGTADDIALGIASSVATITGSSSPKTLTRQSSEASSASTSTTKPLQIDLLLRNCAIGLNPRKMASKGLFVFTDAHVTGKQIKSEYSVQLELRKASVHAIDDIARLEEEHEPGLVSATSTNNRHLYTLHENGYVSLSSISAAKVYVNIAGDGKDQPQRINVEFKNELFVLESCADSTQTLISILNGLQPPMPPSPAEKYRTVVPLQQMMESFTGDAVASDEDFADENFMNTADLVEDEVPTNLEFVGSMYNSQSLPTDEDLGDSLLGEDDLGALATPPLTRQRGEKALLESFQEKFEVSEAEKDFDFNENYFEDPPADHKGTARKWDSTKNQYHLSNEFKVPDAPLKVCIRDMNIIWNLYDGYDWPRTRGIISQAVENVEARAEERRRKTRDDDDDDDFVEEDFLFNSVWIGVPVKDEKGALARRINHDIDDMTSETGSYATSTATRSTGATSRPRSGTKSRRRLKLERSRHKKIAFSLMGVAVDFVVFPPNTGETISSIDVRIRDLEIFDHVPSSTWKKFITCQIDPNERELKRPMVNLQLLTVKPVTDLAASELVIKVNFESLLSLVLHVN